MAELFDSPRFNRVFYRNAVYPGKCVRAAIDDAARLLHRESRWDSPFVYLFAVNHPKTITAYFGAVRAGFVVVLVPPDIGRLELAEMLEDSPPCALVRPRTEGNGCALDLGDVEFTSPQDHDIDSRVLDGVCTMVYTAADDGHAKGAMLTRESLQANARALTLAGGLTSESTACPLLPLCHLFALQTGALTPALSGGSTAIADMPEPGAIGATATWIRRTGVTDLYSVPYTYYYLSKVRNIDKLVSGIRNITSGACKLPSRVLTSFERKSGRMIQEGYGLAEASPICTWHRPGDVIRPDSVGRPLPGCSVRALGEDWRPLPPGTVGEIGVSGPNVMRGYWRNPQATRRTLKSGWLRTGDLGRTDGEGYVYLTGTKKRMFNLGGRKVYPEEVRRLLSASGRVRCVKIERRQSPLGGDRVAIHVGLCVTAKSRMGFDEWCKEALSPHKRAGLNVAPASEEEP